MDDEEYSHYPEREEDWTFTDWRTVELEWRDPSAISDGSGRRRDTYGARTIS